MSHDPETTIVKHGDTGLLTWTVNADLTAATVVGWIQNRDAGSAWVSIPMQIGTVGAESIVTHDMDGTLAIGSYRLVVKATATPSGDVMTFPTEGFHTLRVTPNAT